MKRIIFLLVLALIILPVHAQGVREVYQDAPVTVIDSLDREVTMPALPQRIVLAGRANLFLANVLYLFPEASQRIVALAQTDQGMGSFIPYIDPAYAEKVHLANQASVEEIASLAPELVIIKDSQYRQLGSQLEQLGIPVIALRLESYEDYLYDIGIIGTVLGNAERASYLQKYISDIVSSVQETATRADRTPRTAILYYTVRDGAAAFNIPPAGWIQTYMVTTVGAEAVWASSNLTTGWQTVNFEQIASWDPDYIFLVTYTFPSREVLPVIEDSAAWRQMRAYRNGEIRAFPGDFNSWAQPDMRWLLGLQWLAHELHPDLHDGRSIEQAVYAFFMDLYGVSEQTVTSQILPRIREELPEN